MAPTTAVLASVTRDVPSGSDPETVRQYYEWLYQHYLDRIPAAPGSDWTLGRGAPWQIAWGGPVLQILSVAVVLVGLFWVFARYFNHPRHSRPMLYRPAVFGGTITERHGRLGPFNVILSIGIFLWATYYAVSHVLFGQIY